MKPCVLLDEVKSLKGRRCKKHVLEKETGNERAVNAES
jgi:hypothetical protein